jgi:hypothetical protein
MYACEAATATVTLNLRWPTRPRDRSTSIGDSWLLEDGIPQGHVEHTNGGGRLRCATTCSTLPRLGLELKTSFLVNGDWVLSTVPQMGKFFLCLLADFGEWRGRHQPNKQTKTKIAFF